jgi:MFS superfamily sulfate permease-like transporter
MQTSLKETSSKSSPLFNPSKSNPIKGIAAFTILLPQVLAFALASGIEPKPELYTAIISGVILAALAIARRIQVGYLKKNFKQ